jgi:putative membrane protein
MASIILVAKIIPGINIADYGTAAVAALILVLLNTFIKPLIIIITLPINILSLGLFTFIINTFVFYASSRFVSGFVISNFWSAFAGALCMSAVSFVLNIFVGPFTKVEMNADFNKADTNPHYRDAIDAEIVEPKDENKDKKLLS